MRAEAEAPLVAVEGASLALGGRPVLSDVDLDVRSGEIVTLIGPNGAGKTTLLRLVLGLSTPDAGVVRRRPGVAFGYVPQRFAADPTLPMTVARFLALPRPHPAGAIEAALAEVGAAGLGGRALHALSGGEGQRVLLALALLLRPDLLVLDEPVQGVDVGGQIALFELIASLRRRHGFAVLMVSHDLHLVMRATDRVVCLDGHVCCTGTPRAVGERAEYRALFGEAAARVLAVYAHAHDQAHDEAGRAVAPEAGVEGAPRPAEGADVRG